MMPLTLAKQGEPVTIRKITGKDELRQHLPNWVLLWTPPSRWSARWAET